MFKFFRAIFRTIIFLLVAVVLFLGYMGFIPGLSALFGSDKPRDLGVTYTPEDFESYVSKSGVRFEQLPADATLQDSLKFSGSVNIKTAFTSAEITANLHEKKWKYYPVSQTQVKIHEDGIVETAGILRTDRLGDYAVVQNLPAAEREAMEKYAGYLPSNPPFYVRGQVEVKNNQVELNLEEIRFGKFAIPGSVLKRDGVVSALESFVEGRLNFVPNLNMRSLTFQNGQMNVDGTYPAVQSHAKEQ